MKILEEEKFRNIPASNCGYGAWEQEVNAVEAPGAEEVEKLMTKYLKDCHKEDVMSSSNFQEEH